MLPARMHGFPLFTDAFSAWLITEGFEISSFELAYLLLKADAIY
jgi:hypothetical protein